MAVKIRCRKTGANNDPCFRIIATEGRSPRDGKCLEILGWYDPKKNKANFYLKLERVMAWKSKGAILSETVRSLVKKAHTVPMGAPTKSESTKSALLATPNAEPSKAATA